MQRYDHNTQKRLKRANIPHWLNGGTDFISNLLSLIAKADCSNLRRIEQAFPEEVEAYRRWYFEQQD